MRVYSDCVFTCTLSHHYPNVTVPASVQPVGFIGLGNMGLPMAQNLLANGHELLLYDISQSRVGEVGGGQGEENPRAVAARCSTLVTMLPSGKNVIQCYTGEHGVLSSLPLP